MSEDAFINGVLHIAKERKYPVKVNREGFHQIDFGHKQLHEGHLRKLYQTMLKNIPSLIEEIAPGRPCAHKPTREIVDQLLSGRD